MTADVNLNGVIQGAQNTQNQGISLSQDLDDFLNLLTVQLQNQDPLNPMDSEKLTDQITQFSQVEQQINTNQKLDDLLSLQLASISSVALGYVGLDIKYTSAEFEFDGEKPVEINYALGDQAVSSTINIFDENGDLVYSERGPTGAGQQTFSWSGITGEGGTVIAEKGTYTVSVDAVDIDGKPIDTSTVVTGNVRGIENQNGVIFLLVGERAVAIANVISASVPQDSAPEATGGTDV